jgi:hypothetical protein
MNRFRIFFILLLTATTTATLSGQQTKRNLLSNGNFEEGLKNWRQKNSEGAIRCSVEETAPISGAQSARIEVVAKSPDKASAMLYYLLPVEKDAKYELRFKAKADKPCRLQLAFAKNHPDTAALEIDSMPESFISETVPASLRGNVLLGTEAREYVFLTSGSQAADWNCLFAFYFDHSEAGAVYWIDDIKISRYDDGDWDGNLFPPGDFEGTPPTGSGDFSVKIDKSSLSGCTDFWYIDNYGDGINGSRYLYIERESAAAAFGNFMLCCPYWVNEDANIEISFKIKGNTGGRIAVRTALATWDGSDETSGVFLRLEPSVSTETQAVSGAYTSDSDGLQKLFISFTSGNLTPQGFHAIIDDISVKELNPTPPSDIENPGVSMPAVFSLFPTVVRPGESIHIQTPQQEPASVRIYNITGNLVFIAENVRDIDTSRLSSGLYTVKVIVNDRDECKKIIVK